MDYQLTGLLRRYGLVMMLLVVRFPSIHMNCNRTLENTKALADLVKREATKLLEAYEVFHNIPNHNVSDEVPDATILGTNTSERLQNIYTKEVLFHWHLSKVEKYQEDVGATCLATRVWKLKIRLSDHFLTLKKLLSVLIPGFPLPTEAPPQELFHHDFAKKRYGWGVISNLKGLMTGVFRELTEMNDVCVNA